MDESFQPVEEDNDFESLGPVIARIIYVFMLKTTIMIMKIILRKKKMKYL